MWKGPQQRSIVDASRGFGKLPDRHCIDRNTLELGQSLESIYHLIRHIAQI